jgi:taurine dioxygenase
MTDWTSADGLKWRPLARFGVELDGDLSAPLAGASAERFLALFREFGLIVAHGQSLTLEAQTTLTRLVGPLVQRPQENGYITANPEQSISLSELSFHQDGGYTTAPFAAISLHAVDVVDDASSTRFVSAERAYATLPAALRQQLTSRWAEMISPTYEAIGSRACDRRDPGASVCAELPSVIVNPRTGRACIAVSEMHAARLLDMDWEESRALLGAVYDHLYAPADVVEHVWRGGDLVLFDNVTYQHARGSLVGVGARKLQRVAIAAR